MALQGLIWELWVRNEFRTCVIIRNIQIPRKGHPKITGFRVGIGIMLSVGPSKKFCDSQKSQLNKLMIQSSIFGPYMSGLILVLETQVSYTCKLSAR